MMTDGFVRVAAATPSILVADPTYNAAQIAALMRRAAKRQVQLLVLPELCLTGYTCGDLFLQRTLQQSALAALDALLTESESLELVTVVGLPLEWQGKLYNVAAVLCGGKLLGLVPKTHLPNYGEFYELRHFTPAPPQTGTAVLCGQQAPFGTDLLFRCRELPQLALAVEICEDLWTLTPPSNRHAAAGATVIANLSASDETIGKAGYRRSLVAGQSARLVAGYVYADAGEGESSTDMTFAGHNLVCENGGLLDEGKPFGDGWAESELDLAAIAHDRRRMNTFAHSGKEYLDVPFSLPLQTLALQRHIAMLPFVPTGEAEKSERCEEILAIQVAGLVQRLRHTRAKSAVVGISGGLDSSLALLVICRAFAALGKAPADILAPTMPCFGTTSRTKDNAVRLCKALGVACREIDITEMVRLHLRDIGHPEQLHDTTFENAQARVRTLVLMNLANQNGGLVVGTGDLSELALGWATYNGDHMSMYGVNAGVPKTLIRHMVRYVADSCGKPELREILLDILDTPVSPELLPPDGENISQQTEQIVGPYELHDFFLYHAIRWGRSPAVIHRLAVHAFDGKYGSAVILQWLRSFYRRFFAQQFKRSCLPDGPKVGSVTLSPRGDWRMPSDAVCAAWLEELDRIQEI